MPEQGSFILTSQLPYPEKLHYVTSCYKHSLPDLSNQEELDSMIDTTFHRIDLLGRTWFRISQELRQIARTSNNLYTPAMAGGSFKALSSLQLVHYLEYINGKTAVKGNYPLNKDERSVMRQTLGPDIVNYAYSLMKIPVGQTPGTFMDQKTKTNIHNQWDMRQVSHQIPTAAENRNWGLINPLYNTGEAVDSVMAYTVRSTIDACEESDIPREQINDHIVGMRVVCERYDQLTRPFLN